MGSGLSMASVNKIKELASQREYSLALDIIDSQDLSKSLNSQFLRLCGEIYIREKRYEDARKTLIMAHRLAPEGKRIIFALVDLYLRMGYRELAKTYYDMYMFEADDNVSNTLLIKYIYEKAKGAELSALEAMLAPQYAQTMEYDWSFETFLLYMLQGKKEQAKQLYELYSATFKAADSCETMQEILNGKTEYKELFYIYATEAAEDTDPGMEDLRKEEQRLLENDNLRMNPVEAEIMIEFEEIGNQVSERQMKRLMRKQAREEAKEAARKEAEALKAAEAAKVTEEAGNAEKAGTGEDAGTAENTKPEETKPEEAKTRPEETEKQKETGESTEGEENPARFAVEEDTEEAKEDSEESEDNTEKKGLFGKLFSRFKREKTEEAGEEPEGVPDSEQDPEKTNGEQEAKPEEEASQPDKTGEPEKEEEDRLPEEPKEEKRLTWDDFEKLGPERASEGMSEEPKEEVPEEPKREVVFEEVSFSDEDTTGYEVDDFSEEEPEPAVEPEEPETFEGPEPEEYGSAVWDREASELPEEEPETELETEPEPEIVEEEPEPETTEEEPEIVEEEPEAEPEPETTEEEPEIMEEEPEAEPEPETTEEEPEIMEEEPASEPEPWITPTDFDISYRKPKLDFPKFKTDLFPELNNEIRHVDNTFSRIVSESESKLTDNLEKEARMQREAEELLRSLGIELDSPGSSVSASQEAKEKEPVHEEDDGRARDALKEALKIGPDKKETLKKLKGL